MKRIFALVLALTLYGATAVAQTIPVDQIQFVGGPNIGAFTQTTSITSLTVKNNGVDVQFDKRNGPNRWPDLPFGDPGDSLQYSLGMAIRINGVWTASAPMEFWFGLPQGGGPIQDYTSPCVSGTGQIHCNWFYDGRWAPLNTVHPNPGDAIGIFVCAGDARNSNNPLRERSDIVVITLPPQGVEQTFTFGAAPVPTPLPVPTPVPVPAPPAPQPTPAPLPSTDLSGLIAQGSVYHAEEMAVLQEIRTQVTVLKAEVEEFQAAVKSKWVSIVDSPLFKYGVAAITGFLLKSKVGG